MKTFKCFRCGMTFRVEKPRIDKGKTWCAEGCGVRFWHAAPKSYGPIRVGIDPDDLHFSLPDAATAPDGIPAI